MTLLASFLAKPENDNEKLVFGAIDRYQSYKGMGALIDFLKGDLGKSKMQKMQEQEKALDILLKKRALDLPLTYDDVDDDSSKFMKSVGFRLASKVAPKTIIDYLTKR